MLAYATEIADFYRIQIVAKKILSRGQNGRVGRVSGNKTFFFLGQICMKKFDAEKIFFDKLTGSLT